MQWDSKIVFWWLHATCKEHMIRKRDALFSVTKELKAKLREMKRQNEPKKRENAMRGGKKTSEGKGTSGRLLYVL